MKITKKFNVGDKVRWTSSGTAKIGEIVAIVPSGMTPQEIGHQHAGGGGGPRDHESYVIRGWPQPHRTQTTAPRKAWYWPVVSLLEIEATAEERG